MSGGLKVGSLFVTVNAVTSSFSKSMMSAAKLTETTAKTIKRHATEIGRVGTMMAAGIGAALAVAAQHSKAVSAELANQKAVFGQVAGEIATMMLPALHQMSELLRQGLGWWQSLGTETKSSIGNWVGIATAIGLVSLAVAKVAGIVAAVAPAFAAIGSVASVAFLPIIAALAAIVVGVAIVHKAWRENWGGIQEKTRSVIETISGYWGRFKNWLSTSFFDWFIDKWAAIEKTLAHAGNFLKHPLDEGQRGAMNRGADQDIDKWARSMKGGAMGESLKLAADKVKDFAGVVTSEWKLMAKEVGDAFKKAAGFTGAAGSVSSAAPKGQWFEAMGYTKESHDRIESNVSRGHRMGGTAVAVRSSEDARDSAAEFWKGMEDLGPMGAQIVSAGYGFKESIKTAFDGISRSIMSAAMSVTSKLGDLGQVINSAVSGFQSGGWIGAIVAVVMELFSMWEGFAEILDYANSQVMGAIKDLAGGFEGLKDGLMPLMDALGVVTDVSMSQIAPILKIVGKVLKAIAPMIEAIAVSFSGLTPIFELLEAILGPIIEAIGYVLRFVGLTILGTMNGLLMLWQGILEAVREIVKVFDRGAAEEINKEMSKNWQKILGVQEQMRNLFETGSINRGERSIDKLADAADRAAESLTNIPSGVKVALAQFTAMQGLAGTASSTSGEATFSYDAVIREDKRQTFRKTGNGTGGTW